MPKKKTLLVAAGMAGALAWAAKDLPSNFGAQPSGERAERVRRSPQFRNGAFVNAEHPPAEVDPEERHRVRELMLGGNTRKPHGTIPVVHDEFPPSDETALHITWFGHASTLVEIDG